MFNIDDKDFKQFEENLNNVHKYALVDTIRGTLNAEAYETMVNYKKEVRSELTIRTPKNNIVIKSIGWDGASIPWFAWRIIGAKTDSRFAIPSLIHDLMCENKQFVNYDRYFADKIFERLLYVSKVPAVKRWAMFHSVDNFQKLQNWEEKK